MWLRIKGNNRTRKFIFICLSTGYPWIHLGHIYFVWKTFSLFQFIKWPPAVRENTKMRDPSIERYIPQLSDIFSWWTLRARIRCSGSNFDLYLMAVCILHNFNWTKSDVSRPQFGGSLLRSCGNHLERRSKWKNERRKDCQSNEKHKGVPYFSYQTTFLDTGEPPHRIPRRVHITQLSYISLNWGIPHFRVFPDWPAECSCFGSQSMLKFQKAKKLYK